MYIHTGHPHTIGLLHSISTTLVQRTRIIDALINRTCLFALYSRSIYATNVYINAIFSCSICGAWIVSACKSHKAQGRQVENYRYIFRTTYLKRARQAKTVAISMGRLFPICEGGFVAWDCGFLDTPNKINSAGD